MDTIEEHPWKWFVPDYAKCLVVGTHPTHRKNWSFDFFYPNRRNFFWKIISEIRGAGFVHPTGAEAVEERMRALESLKVGVTDMGLIVKRGGGRSSLDEKLQIVEYMDIHHILALHPTISTVLLTSSSGKVNARVWFQEYLQAKNVILRFDPDKKKSQFRFAPDRIIQVVVLPSPSPRYANASRLTAITNLYKTHIVST